MTRALTATLLVAAALWLDVACALIVVAALR